ncbi:Na+/H+ antiporter subunit D [Halorussus gelatinilyticus]|uniref:Na+/H+ antiporter subunit D n=1 Tax=Halorussus gelatinilyticus TaxID=2937524 RepID=A0A8U0IG61_9EURY|nr:proton-conducting transporter membrane subunit [Halorussus gelatinilyticus]UPV99263.1 Na+/H+ antiporter subunit D [Halorussus gelatinilyticus]
MSGQFVIAPLLVALVTAIATLLTRRFARTQMTLSLLGGAGYVGAVAWLVSKVDPLGATNVFSYQLSGWQAPFGITLVADSLSAFMLAFSSVVALAALVFSAAYVDTFGQRVSYHPLYHFMLVGVTGSFLTGDIFNLFVWFEVMLMSSYVLVVFYSGPEHTRAALQYVVLNLVGSAVMLLAIGGLYSTTGTLNMADLSRRVANPAAYGLADGGVAPVLGLSALLFAVFALKAGLAPFQFWVPAAYRAAPAPVSAMLAGVVKKVGVYAIIRVYFTVFGAAALGDLSLPGLSVPDGGSALLAFYGPILFLMAAASIVVGGLGAVGRDDIDGLLAYSSIGQVGFIVLPLAIAATATDESIRVLGVSAALVYALNHGFAKSLLFMASGAVYDAVGTEQFPDLGGLSESAPWLSGGFFVGALALIGIPPLSGFFGKMLVFDAAGQARSTIALAVALFGAILTIAYFSRAWNRGFWGEPSLLVQHGETKLTLVAVVVAMALAIAVLGVGFDVVMQAAQAGAEAALDRQEYVDTVLGGGSGAENGTAGGGGGGHS